MLNIVIFVSAPGCGKGSFSKRLKKDFGFGYLSTGDIFRNMIKNGSGELAEQLKQTMNAGKLVDAELTNKIVEDALLNFEDEKTVILDGYPRNKKQVDFLTSLAEKNVLSIKKVIVLNVDYEILKQRITSRLICFGCGEIYNTANRLPKKEGVCNICGEKVGKRSEDTEEVLKIRFDDFLENKNLLTSFKDESIIEEISVEGNFNENFEKVLKVLKLK